MGERGTTQLASIEEFDATEARAAPGDHVVLLSDRSNDAEAFFVLEGELTFRLGDAEHPVEQETWAFVPPSVTYTLAATGNGPTRFLHIRVPSSGVAQDFVIRRAGGSEGENITDRPERRATVLVETDELTISEFDYGPGERGAEPHVHRHHADGFLVVEGEFTFHFRDGPLTLSAGTLLVIPPSVVHGFDNDSAAHARCFNFHMPSFGFADYMRGKNPGFDQLDPPADGGVDPASVLVVRLPE
jgi:mannose-6-phosphate isomerase-like protein (cupin superfamily)